jgi:hypothetical protein
LTGTKTFIAFLPNASGQNSTEMNRLAPPMFPGF